MILPVCYERLSQPNPHRLIFTQGTLFAFVGSSLYCPVTDVCFEWWVDRRGLHRGSRHSGAGIGGLTLPFITTALLDRLGMRQHSPHRVSLFLFSGAVLFRSSVNETPLGSNKDERPPNNKKMENANRFRQIGILVTLARSTLSRSRLGICSHLAYTSELFSENVGYGLAIGALTIAHINLSSIPAQIIVGFS